MDNKIEHFFAIKPNGKIYWVEKMPKEPIKRESFESYAGTVYMGGDFGYEKAHAKYQQALQSAIDNAVEVSNFDETEDALLDAHATDHGFRLEVGKIYSLQCSVEKDIKYVPIGRGLHYKVEGDDTLRQADLVTGGIGYMVKIVALVTFSQPDTETVEETQEERKIDLWNKVIELLMFCEADGTVVNGYRSQEIINQLRDITRKTP